MIAKSRKQKKRRANKELIKITAVLLSFLVIIFIIGITAIIFISNAKKMDMPVSYSSQNLVYGNVIDSDIQTTSGFAENLCVTTEDVGNNNISLQDNSIGGLFNLDDKTIEFSSHLYDQVYPASITKIMTAILTEKYADMNDVVTITSEDLNLESGSQVVGFEVGDQVTVNELFHGLLIHSGNDAAMALARHVGGTVDNFVKMMNEEANNIGAFNTHFMNPSGLHHASHYTSVYDIYLMLNEAMSYPHFMEVMQLSVYNLTYTSDYGTEKSVNLDSTDHYLTKEVSAPKGVTVLGGKTGTTGLAGNCLALLSQNAYGEPHISIILRASTKTSLYDQMNQLLAESNS